eukprot:86217-Rhodomonas_salina.1
MRRGGCSWSGWQHVRRHVPRRRADTTGACYTTPTLAGHVLRSTTPTVLTCSELYKPASRTHVCE